MNPLECKKKNRSNKMENIGFKGAVEDVVASRGGVADCTQLNTPSPPWFVRSGLL